MICPKCNYNNPFGNYCIKCGSLLKNKADLIPKPKSYGDAPSNAENSPQKIGSQFPGNMGYKSQSVLNTKRRGL